MFPDELITESGTERRRDPAEEVRFRTWIVDRENEVRVRLGMDKIQWPPVDEPPPPPPPPPPKSWQDTDDLIDPLFRPVLGCHTGGGSDPDLIAAQMGQRIQAAPIYWKTADSPKGACERMLAKGCMPRLELCLPHIWTSSGRGQTGANFWSRVVDGMHDGWIIDLLKPVGELGRPILLSFSHEADLRSEDGASPKNENPPSDTWCGQWTDYPAYHEHVAALVRQHAPKARIFLNWSGGYSDAPKRWSQMLPPAGTFDFFGWDPYSQYGKQDGAQWDDFDQRLKMFGRWDWYRDTIPDVPIIIGETGVCEGPGGVKHAGRWLVEMVEFVTDNAWKGVGTGGGISQVHYFSHHYDAHPRCLDDAGTHKGCDSGQRSGVLAQIGADERLAWA